MTTPKLAMRAAIITSGAPTSWKSCVSIEAGIVASTIAVFKNVKTLPLVENPAGVWLTAQKILRYKPKKIIFAAHKPHPLNLFSALEMLDPKGGRLGATEICFHLYGDVPLYAAQWESLSRKLLGQKLSLITSSRRQAEVFKSLVRSHRIHIAPYPVSTETFQFSSENRKYWREKLDLNQFTILYSGRISLQKNVLPMLHDVVRSRRPENTQILLAGWFDDLGIPYFGQSQKRAQYFQEFDGFLRQLPRAWKTQIRWLGDLDPSDLSGVYNASDLMVSLSAHHDEEFGMAPAEGLCTGLPAILTDWAGYSSFRGPGVGFVTVLPQDRRIGYNTKEFQGLLKMTQPLTEPRRQRLAHTAQSRFSINAVALKLHQIHCKRVENFAGFKDELIEFRKRLDVGAPFPKGPQKDSLYSRIYEHYYRD